MEIDKSKRIVITDENVLDWVKTYISGIELALTTDDIDDKSKLQLITQARKNALDEFEFYTKTH